MDKDKNQKGRQQSLQGTGSAENIGRTRKEQKNRMANLGEKQKQKIARETSLGKKNIADTGDTGGLSGRDDYAGGDNEGMTNESTNERTDL
jgi:hypothetical protein